MEGGAVRACTVYTIPFPPTASFFSHQDFYDNKARVTKNALYPLIEHPSQSIKYLSLQTNIKQWIPLTLTTEKHWNVI